MGGDSVSNDLSIPQEENDMASKPRNLSKNTPYYCEPCQRWFTNQGNLNKHQESETCRKITAASEKLKEEREKCYALLYTDMAACEEAVRNNDRKALLWIKEHVPQNWTSRLAVVAIDEEDEDTLEWLHENGLHLEIEVALAAIERGDLILLKKIIQSYEGELVYDLMVNAAAGTGNPKLFRWVTNKFVNLVTFDTLRAYAESVYINGDILSDIIAGLEKEEMEGNKEVLTWAVRNLEMLKHLSGYRFGFDAHALFLAAVDCGSVEVLDWIWQCDGGLTGIYPYEDVMIAGVIRGDLTILNWLKHHFSVNKAVVLAAIERHQRGVITWIHTEPKMPGWGCIGPTTEEILAHLPDDFGFLMWLNDLGVLAPEFWARLWEQHPDRFGITKPSLLKWWDKRIRKGKTASEVEKTPNVLLTPKKTLEELTASLFSSLLHLMKKRHGVLVKDPTSPIGLAPKKFPGVFNVTAYLEQIFEIFKDQYPDPMELFQSIGDAVMRAAIELEDTVLLHTANDRIYLNNYRYDRERLNLWNIAACSNSITMLTELEHLDMLAKEEKLIEAAHSAASNGLWDNVFWLYSLAMRLHYGKDQWSAVLTTSFVAMNKESFYCNEYKDIKKKTKKMLKKGVLVTPELAAAIIGAHDVKLLSYIRKHEHYHFGPEEFLAAVRTGLLSVLEVVKGDLKVVEIPNVLPAAVVGGGEMLDLCWGFLNCNREEYICLLHAAIDAGKKDIFLRPFSYRAMKNGENVIHINKFSPGNFPSHYAELFEHAFRKEAWDIIEILTVSK